MRFIEIIKNKKILLISILLTTYILFNLLEGERGLVSYFEKQKIKKMLIDNKEKLTRELNVVNNKNSLLSDNIDLDYLEILYREKFMVGEKEEKIYIINN
jgi:cell division protein FtsB